MVKTILRVLSASWLVKAVLALTFFVQSGCFTSTASFFASEFKTFFSDSGYGEMESQRNRLLEMKPDTDRMYKEALAKGEHYLALDYFDDLSEIEMLSRKHKVMLRGGFMYDGLTHRHDLLQLYRENSNKLGKRDLDRHERELALGQAKFRRVSDSLALFYDRLGRDLPEDGNGETEPFFFPVLLKALLYFFGVYTKGLPLVCVLFLVWMRGDGKVFRSGLTEYELRVRRALWTWKSPLLLVGYPYVFATVLVNRFDREIRKVYSEAEIRLTKKNAFQRLSEHDMTLVASFVREGLSRREIRGRLEALGRTRRHWYATALLATLVVAFVTALVPLTVTTVSLDLVFSDGDESDSRAGPSPIDIDLTGTATLSGLSLLPVGLVLRSEPRVLGRYEEPLDPVPIFRLFVSKATSNKQSGASLPDRWRYNGLETDDSWHHPLRGWKRSAFGYGGLDTRLLRLLAGAV